MEKQPVRKSPERAPLKPISGQELKREIMSSTFLPDHPAVFRRQQVELALHQRGVTCPRSTLDTQLFKLLQQGFLERSSEKEPDPATKQPIYWYRFASPARTSERPGFRIGEPGYVKLWTPKS